MTVEKKKKQKQLDNQMHSKQPEQKKMQEKP
jgi:hypothetical protein